MAVTADSVIVELEAKVDGYQAGIAGASAATTKAMSSIERSAGQAEASMRGSLSKIETASNSAGASQQILQSIVRRTTDQFAAGAPISIILAEHLSGVAEAGALAGGKLGALGEFLGGPWGLAVSAAVSVLAILIGKFGEGEKGAKKQKDAIDLLTDALGHYAKANGQAVNNDYVRIRLMELATRELANQEVATRRLTVAQLEAAKQRTGENLTTTQRLLGGTDAEQGRNVARAQVVSLQAQLDAQNKSLADAERRSRVATSARIEADNAADPTGKDPIAAAAARVKAAQDRYALQLAALERQRAKEQITQDQFDERQGAAQNALLTIQNADANQRKDDAAQRRQASADRKAQTAAEREANKELREATKAAAEAERQRAEVSKALTAVSRDFEASFNRTMASENRAGIAGFERDQDRQQQGAIDAGEAFRKKQEENIKSLADLYETAFTRGAKGIGDALRQELQHAIAVSLAKLTISKLGSLASSSGLLSSFGGLFGGGPTALTSSQITSSLGTLGTSAGLAGSLGGRASGGYVGAGQLYQVNEGASPGNVEGFRPQGSGTIIPLGQMKAMGGGGTTVLQTFHLDLKGAVLTSDLVAQMNAVGDAAAQRGAAGGSAMAQATIARRSLYRL